VEGHERLYTFKEEVANVLTHGLGAVFSIVGLGFLVVFAAMGADPWRIVSVSIFGATMLLMYLASTLYHALPHPPVKKALRVCDHCCIYLLIAGTYTPFALVSLRGPWGWTLFGLMWGIAAAGCLFKIFFMDHAKSCWQDRVSTLLYVLMGWMVIFAFKPSLELIPPGALFLCLLGGLAYTGGVVFYLWERLPYNHAIWHLFVLGGSVLHFCAIFYYILPVPQSGVAG